MSLLGGPIGGLLVFNLLFTVAVPGISIGGHLGGLVGGVSAAWCCPPSAAGTWRTAGSRR